MILRVTAARVNKFSEPGHGPAGQLFFEGCAANEASVSANE
jgi:hypothetical protein